MNLPLTRPASLTFPNDARSYIGPSQSSSVELEDKLIAGLNEIAKIAEQANAPEVPARDLISWSWVASSSRRENAFEGMLFGSAVGEALALPKDGFSRRQGLKLFGGPPSRFKFIPGVGFPSERTHSLLMTTQAMLASRASHKEFDKKLKVRGRWYELGSPARSLARFLRPRLPVKNHQIAVPRRVGSDPIPKAVAISLLIQGSQSAEPWVDVSTKHSVQGKEAADTCMLIAQAVQLAQMLDPSDPPFTTQEALECLLLHTSDPTLQIYLRTLRGCLANRYSVAKTAKVFGWHRGVPNDLRAIATMGLYAWMRHPFRFRFAVERAVLLGGSANAVGALAGALSGITLGKRGIPKEWVKRVNLYPHDKRWIDDLIDRVKDWPHGVEDIQNAKSEQTLILGQLGRNAIYTTFRLLHILIRVPGRFVSSR